jgi:16S rRNA (cytosine967-C5)-methyltransferase
LKPVKNKTHHNARNIALDAVLSVVVHKKSLSDFDFQQQGFATLLAFGTIRFYHHLVDVINPLLKRDFDKKDLDIFCILLLGSYQLLYEDNPAYAVVNESINLTNKQWAKGLINALLRKVSTIEVSVHNSHPKWLEKKITRQYPDDYKQILYYNNQKPPMTLRVNGNTQEYQQQLRDIGISSKTLPNIPQALVLESPVAVSQLPNFQNGSCYVQDASPQLCNEILKPQNGELILDSCAAPGGKTTHLANCKSATIIALDNNEHRLQKVIENQQRMGQDNIRTVLGDATHTDWWDGMLFDKILLDAPCSATGVIRRHPDIKLLRKASDINKLVCVQQQMLENLWQMLKPNGVLLYATCSILEAENSQQIRNFLHTHSNCKLEHIDSDWGNQDIGIQQLPSADFDGFYYAKLRKINTT